MSYVIVACVGADKYVIKFVSHLICICFMYRLIELDNKIFEFTKCFCNLQLNFLKFFEVNSENRERNR